jgi:PTS system nitrogen regulatory IIA component
MRLSDILSVDRILVDAEGNLVQEKSDALRILAHMLSPVVGVDHATVERLLTERERLQSTGVGDGVAIPHTSVESAPGQAAALLISRPGVPFEAIDGAKVNIIFGVVGPRRATGEHLRILARISRLLRDAAARRRLIETASPEEAFELISTQDASLK